MSHNEFHIPGPVVEFRRPPFDSEADVSLCLAFGKLARDQVEVHSDVSPMTRMTGRGGPGIAAVHAAQPDHATSTSVGSIGGNVVDRQQDQGAHDQEGHRRRHRPAMACARNSCLILFLTGEGRRYLKNPAWGRNLVPDCPWFTEKNAGRERGTNPPSQARTFRDPTTRRPTRTETGQGSRGSPTSRSTGTR